MKLDLYLNDDAAIKAGLDPIEDGALKVTKKQEKI